MQHHLLTIFIAFIGISYQTLTPGVYLKHKRHPNYQGLSEQIAGTLVYQVSCIPHRIIQIDLVLNNGNFDLSEIELTDEILAKIIEDLFLYIDISNIRSIDLSDNKLTKLPQNIQILTALERINLRGNSIQTLPLKEIKSLARLNYISLQDFHGRSFTLERHPEIVNNLPQILGNIKSEYRIHQAQLSYCERLKQLFS